MRNAALKTVHDAGNKAPTSYKKKKNNNNYKYFSADLHACCMKGFGLDYPTRLSGRLVKICVDLAGLALPEVVACCWRPRPGTPSTCSSGGASAVEVDEAIGQARDAPVIACCAATSRKEYQEAKQAKNHPKHAINNRGSRRCQGGSSRAAHVQGVEETRAGQVHGSLLRPPREAAGKGGGTMLERGAIDVGCIGEWKGQEAGCDGSGCGKGQKRRPARHIARLRARSLMNCAASGLHLPPIAIPSTTRQQRADWSNSV